MKHWISAMRLRTLPLSFSNILLGSALAYSLSNSPMWNREKFSWTIFTLTLLTTLLLQILSNFANDYGDAKKGADNADRIGPERAIQSGLISPKDMLRAIIITALLALISGIFLLLESFDYQVDWTFISFVLLGLLTIAAAIKYTVGKGAYGYSGLGDLFVFIFFGIVGVLGPIYLQLHEVHMALIIPAITMGCFSVAVLNLNNMRDRANDQKVGKNTLAVKFGFKGSKIYHFILFIIAYSTFSVLLLWIGITEGSYLYFLVAVLPIFVIHVIHLRKVYLTKDPKDFDPELKKIALSAFLFSMLFFIVVIF